MDKSRNFFKEQYDTSEKIRRGVDMILKSSAYTEEYKNKIRSQLNMDSSTAFPEGSSLSVREGDERTPAIISNQQGSVTGYLERPVYNEGELIKAVDTIVDELIPRGPRNLPETVLKTLYDAKVQELTLAINEQIRLQDLLNQALADIEGLRAQIEALLQSIDTEKILTATANNEADATNTRYQSLLIDFQEALQKGIQEAIERVSLQAQVRGLQAQKEVLIQTTESLQQQIQLLQAQIEFQQEEQAAQLLLNGETNGYGIAPDGDVGWKIPDEQIRNRADMTNKLQTLRYQSGRGWVNGPSMDLYNITENPVTFTFDYTPGFEGFSSTPSSKTWVGGPSEITVPPREGADPGVIRVNFTADTSGFWGGDNDFKDTITIQANGAQWKIQANYYRN